MKDKVFVVYLQKKLMENIKLKEPQEILKKMMTHDYFSQWLGLEFLAIEKGMCQLKFQVKKEMLNGFQSIHGGILFSAADSAFAFACNSHGWANVALECSISYARPAFEGQILVLTASEINRGKTTGIYEVKITNEENKLVALFKGISFNTQKAH